MTSPQALSRPRRFPAGPLLLLAGAAASLRYLLAEIARLKGALGFPLDDSWIHLQFARNLARGLGLSYNPGHLVTGSTAPLWTALLSLLFLLPGNVVVWTKALGIALHLAGIEATRRLARELGLSAGFAALAAGLTLATSWLVWSALSGMEIPLFILLSLWGMILHLRERAAPERLPLSAGLLAVAALARPEAMLLLGLAFVDRFLVFTGPEGERRWRAPSPRTLLLAAAFAVCALAGPCLFYRWAGGSVLPTTWAAKGGGGAHGVLPNQRYLVNVLSLFFQPQPWMTLLAGAGALTLAARLGTLRERGLLPALWLFSLPLAYSVLTPGPTQMLGNFGRYYFPLFPVLAILGVLGLEKPVRALGTLLSPSLRMPLAALGLAFLFAPTLANLFRGESFYVQNVANVEESDVAVARWLAARVPPGAVLAVNDIGAIKYLLPNPIVDLASIATPEIRREVQRAVAAGMPWNDAMVAAVERRRPDYVVIFPSWVPGIAQDSRFRPVHHLEIQDNITMGGSEIVVYDTPWTRYPLRP
jgi:arabinofuranosyltransferase